MYLCAGLEVDIDGEVLEKDVLTVQNDNLQFQKRVQKEELEEKINTMAEKAAREKEISEHQLGALEEMNSGSIEYLKKSIADQKKKFQEERKAWRLEMQVRLE